MKRIFTYILLLSFICISTTACTQKKHNQNNNMIQSKRRFANYMETQDQKDPTHIDLSEGPKLRYDAKFGPKKLDFDVKIVDPY